MITVSPGTQYPSGYSPGDNTVKIRRRTPTRAPTPQPPHPRPYYVTMPVLPGYSRDGGCGVDGSFNRRFFATPIAACHSECSEESLVARRFFAALRMTGWGTRRSKKPPVERVDGWGPLWASVVQWCRSFDVLTVGKWIGNGLWASVVQWCRSFYISRTLPGRIAL